MEQKAHGRLMRAGLVALIATGAVLCLVNLGHVAFWDDEAQVAILARNLNRQGRLTGWDGRNLYAYRNGSLLDASLRPRNPPLDVLVCAAGFRLLGESEVSARLPFALAALVALAAFVALVRADFGRGPVALYAAAFLAFSPGFYLNARQCRYYALVMLFAVLTVFFYRRSLRDGRWRDSALLALSATGLFYSQYLLAACLLLALAVAHLAFHRRDCAPAVWRQLLVAAVLFVALTLPYAVRYRVWDRPDMEPTDPWPVQKAILLAWHARDVNAVAMLPWPVALGLAVALWRRRRAPAWRPALEWASLAAFVVLFLVLFSPQPTHYRSDRASVRYFIVATPLLAGLIGLLLAEVGRRCRWLALLLLAALACTNVLTLHPWHRGFRWLLPAFVAEISRDYPTAYRDVAERLRRLAADEEVVLAEEEYHTYPLMFYEGHRLRFGCLLNRASPLCEGVVRRLAAPLYLEEHFPHWVVVFGRSRRAAELIELFSRPHQEKGREVRYQYRRLKESVDRYWFDTSRPELHWHTFGPKTDFDRSHEAVYLFRRSLAEAP